MSREIKFRAWDKAEGAMHEVAWLRFEDGNNLSNVGSYWNDNQHNGASRLDPNKVVHMQYTGLKDKNGVEIYEGDIVNLGFRDGEPEKWVYEPGVIKWWMPSAAFKWFSLEEDPSDANNYWLQQAYSGTREVIGNIYENPELLDAA